MTDWTAENLRSWDERAPAHAASPGYAVERFLADPAYLSDVVRFDLPLLGDLAGMRGVHLQCHIGTDTVSLARLGARMTGLDNSAAAIGEARRLAEATGAAADFVVADVHDALDVLEPGGYDLVFTGVGALCWLPDVRPWARIVAGLLRPGGRLFVREGHPVLWAVDPMQSDGTLLLVDPYVQTPEPVTYDEPGTYVETDVEFVHTVSHTWNHGVGEIITAVLDAGLELVGFEEHDSVPWNAFEPGAMEEVGGGEWRLKDRPERLPHTYTLQAVRRSG